MSGRISLNSTIDHSGKSSILHSGMIEGKIGKGLKKRKKDKHALAGYWLDTDYLDMPNV